MRRVDLCRRAIEEALSMKKKCAYDGSNTSIQIQIDRALSLVLLGYLTLIDGSSFRCISLSGSAVYKCTAISCECEGWQFTGRCIHSTACQIYTAAAAK